MGEDSSASTGVIIVSTSPKRTHARKLSAGDRPPLRPAGPESDMDIDDLTSKMADMESSLAFVPRSIRRSARAVETGQSTLRFG